MKRVLIISHNKYPHGDAGAVRDSAFAQIYQSLGYAVDCICGHPEGVEGNYHDVRYLGCMCSGSGLRKQIRSQLFARKRLIRCVRKLYIGDESPEIIHYVSQNIQATRWIKKYAKKHGAILLYACVEWYSASNYKGGVFAAPYLINHIINRVIIDRQFSVICISRFFERYYSKKGNSVTRIPAIMNKNDYYGPAKRSSEKLRLCYIGSPDNKDNLRDIFRAIEQLSDHEKNRLEIHVVGVDVNQLAAVLRCETSAIERDFRHVFVYGRVLRDRAVEILKGSDFSILIRPANEAYSQAGFPTKFVEAMMNSVPMICNLTSDLELYLKDGYNGIIVQSDRAEDIAIALRRALGLSLEERGRLSLNARAIAEGVFDYRLYIGAVKEIISKQEGKMNVH